MIKFSILMTVVLISATLKKCSYKLTIRLQEYINSVAKMTIVTHLAGNKKLGGVRMWYNFLILGAYTAYLWVTKGV